MLPCCVLHSSTSFESLLNLTTPTTPASTPTTATTGTADSPSELQSEACSELLLRPDEPSECEPPAAPTGLPSKGMFLFLACARCPVGARLLSTC